MKKNCIINKIALLIAISITNFFCFNLLFAQTITNVQAKQEGNNVMITYDVLGEENLEKVAAYLSSIYHTHQFLY